MLKEGAITELFEPSQKRIFLPPYRAFLDLLALVQEQRRPQCKHFVRAPNPRLLMRLRVCGIPPEIANSLRPSPLPASGKHGLSRCSSLRKRMAARQASIKAIAWHLSVLRRFLGIHRPAGIECTTGGSANGQILRRCTHPVERGRDDLWARPRQPCGLALQV